MDRRILEAERAVDAHQQPHRRLGNVVVERGGPGAIVPRRGLFAASGMPPRFDAQCPSCKSLERHRHQYLWLKEHEGALRKKRILHFAPEPVMRKI